MRGAETRPSARVSASGRPRALFAALVVSVLIAGGCAGHQHHDQEGHGQGQENHQGHGGGGDGHGDHAEGHDHTSHNLSPPEDQEADPAPRGPEPAGVRIPSLGVESDLLHTGVRPDGTAEVPEEFDIASWYDEGGRTGENRPTVLLGHVDSADGPGVFAHIDELGDGDPIEVTDAEGEVHAYGVVDVQVYPYDGFPTFDVFGSTGTDTLRLVTCTGAFDPDEGSYEDNLVVFAENTEA